MRAFREAVEAGDMELADSRDHALVFTALIGELTVMVRPLSAAQALRAAMAARFEEIAADAAAS